LVGAAGIHHAAAIFDGIGERLFAEDVFAGSGGTNRLFSMG
jgi:hypothetical protein